MCDTYRLSADESDFDANGLHHTSYLLHNERAANNALGAVFTSTDSNWYQHVSQGSSVVLRRVVLVKYSTSGRVQYGDVVDIHTTLATNPEPDQEIADDEQMVLHEWLRDGKVAHTCLAVYRLVTNRSGCSATLSGAREPTEQVSRRIRALQREAASTRFEPATRTASDTFTVFPDMLSGTSLSMAACLRLMDSHRTAAVLGGPKHLVQLRREHSLFVAVYVGSDFELPLPPVAPNHEVVVTSGFEVQNEMFVSVQQSITHADTGARVASARFRLAFVKGDEVVKAPSTMLQHQQQQAVPVASPARPAAKTIPLAIASADGVVRTPRGPPASETEREREERMRAKLWELCKNESVCGF